MTCAVFLANQNKVSDSSQIVFHLYMTCVLKIPNPMCC